MALSQEDLLLLNKRETLLALISSDQSNEDKISAMSELITKLELDLYGPNQLFNLDSNMSNYAANPLINTAKYLGMDFIVDLEDIQ